MKNTIRIIGIATFFLALLASQLSYGLINTYMHGGVIEIKFPNSQLRCEKFPFITVAEIDVKGNVFAKKTDLNAKQSVINQVAGFKIILDYRYDNGYFSNHPERKTVLEYAVRLWENVITTEAKLPAGFSVNRIFDHTKAGKKTVIYEQEQKGYVLLIYAHDFSKEVNKKGEPDPRNAKAYAGNLGFGTHLGYLAFNTNPNRPWYFDQTLKTAYDVPVSTHYDFITTAVHEIGHALGFTLNNMNPNVVQKDGKDYFNGDNAKSANNSKPVPLKKESSHIRGDFANDNYLVCPPLDRHVMHTGDPVQGYRQLMTKIDVAILDDIGWDVDYNNIPVYPYTPLGDPRKNNLEEFGIYSFTINPVGLWRFDNPDYVDDALIGYPLRYSPLDTDTKGIPSLVVQNQNCIQVPKGGFLYCSHGISKSGGGNDANIYTIVFDIRVEDISIYHALYNCNFKNKNDAEVFLNKSGKFGKGKSYSTKVISAGRWVRLAISVDANLGVANFYINGEYSHQKDNLSVDGSFSMFSKESGKGIITLFSDDDGEDNNIDVRGVAIYNRALTASQMSALGDATNLSFGL